MLRLFPLVTHTLAQANAETIEQSIWWSEREMRHYCFILCASSASGINQHAAHRHLNLLPCSLSSHPCHISPMRYNTHSTRCLCPHNARVEKIHRWSPIHTHNPRECVFLWNISCSTISMLRRKATAFAFETYWSWPSILAIQVYRRIWILKKIAK